MLHFENARFAKFGHDLAGPILKPELPNGPLKKMNMEKCETHRRMCSAEEPGWAKGRSDGEADTRKNGRL
jgi:hypothetical protein